MAMKPTFPPQSCYIKSEVRIYRYNGLSQPFIFRHVAPFSSLTCHSKNSRTIKGHILALISHRDINNSFASSLSQNQEATKPFIPSSSDESDQEMQNPSSIADEDNTQSDQEMQNLSSIADEDNTQIDQEIQNLVTRLDEHYVLLEKKKQVLENAIRSDIEALNKDQNEARKLRHGLLHGSGDITRSLESASQNIANVKKWLINQNALESDDDDQDQSNNFSVLIVDDDRIVRETNRRFTGLAGTQKQLRMEFQEAKNGKEAVYLHLAGASFDLILMDCQMPIMNGIQATQLLRQMGVKSRIVGVTSESDQQAFFDAGLNNCIQKPLNPAKIAEFLTVSKKRKRIGTSQA